MNPAILITSSRVIIALFFSYFFIKAVDGNLYTANKTFLIISIGCAVLIELSDALDGTIARKRNQVTPFGKIFDPVCDSVARQTVFCTFMYTGIIPLWMFFTFLYRDAILSFIRIMNAIDGTVLAAKLSGKLKAIFQAIGIFFVLIVVFCHTFNIGSVPEKVAGIHPGFWIMLFPAIFTVISMFDYLFPSLPIIKKMTSMEKKD